MLEANMSLGLLTVYVATAGVIGGILNALISDNGFILPRTETAAGVTILRPGVVGNVITGIVAAVASWFLYGPVKDVAIGTSGASLTITPGELAGAFVIAMAGAKWLTNEVDKRLLRAAAAVAGAAQPTAANQSTVNQLAIARPAEALNLAKSM